MSSHTPARPEPSDNFKPRRILIFGATGLIGSHITRSILQARGEFEEIAIFTSPGTVERKASVISSLENAGARIIAGDIQNEEDVKQAYDGIDTVISCVGRNAIEAQIPLIHLAAESSSVKWFLPSEYGTDIEYGPESAKEIPHQKKLKVRAAMSEHKGSLDYTYVVTGPYGDGDAGLYLSSNASAEETGSFDVRNKSAVLLGDGQLKIGLTTMKE